jgi:autotransporter-associated beta strand protein
MISGSGGITRQGAGSGQLLLNGNNSYTGVTAISAGGIAISSSNALGATGSGNHTTIAATGATNSPRLSISGTINSPENITLTGTTETAQFVGAIINTNNTNTLSGNITLAGSGGLKIQAENGTLNLTGNIVQTSTSHPFVLQPRAATAAINVSNPIQNNGGELILVGLNSAPGALVTLNASSGGGIGATQLGQQVTLRLGVTNALNTAANLTVSYGGTNTGEDRATLDLRGFNQTVNALIGNVGTGASPSADSSRLVTNGVAGTSIFTVGNGNGTGTFRGQINSGTGNIQLIKTGTGNQTLASTNSYTGGTRIDNGILTLGNATNTLADTGAINVNGGTLALGANSDTVGAVTLTSGSITSSTGVLTGASYAVQSGSASAILGGAGIALTKSTAGTVTLIGVNTYTGATTVNAGTLVVNGSLAAGSAVSVGVNGTLGGTGTINGATTILGAHTPGTSPGIQTFASDLSYSGGNSTVQWELVENTTTNPPNPNADYDQIIVGGNLDFDGATSLNLVFNGVGSSVLWANSFWDTDQQWTLYDVTGSTTDFGNLSLAAGSYLDSGSNTLASARPSASFSISQSGSDVLISYVAVPEPATIAILGTSVALVALRVARRRKA